jgi:integrase/recombinase XerD
MHKRERTEKIKFLTPDKIIRLFSVIESKRDRAIFFIAYRHSLRASEVGHLRSTDLDLTRFRIRLYRLKGSHGGEHPLQPDEVKTIKSYLRSRSDNSPILFPSNRREPISRQMLDVLMKRYSEVAKIPQDKRHFHVLKHSIATHLLDAGAECFKFSVSNQSADMALWQSCIVSGFGIGEKQTLGNGICQNWVLKRKKPAPVRARTGTVSRAVRHGQLSAPLLPSPSRETSPEF